MKIDLKGINKVHRRHVDGTVSTFYYLGRHKGAPKLEGEPRSPEFIETYRRATEKRKISPNRIRT